MSDTITGIASGLTALLLLIIFTGICLWTYSRSRRAGYKAASQLPLEEDDVRRPPPAGDAP